MTSQQIKDYEKVQSLEILKLWTEWDERYKGLTLEELPLECAISDMEMILSDGEDTHTKATINKAKQFLKKYAWDGAKQKAVK